MVHSQSALDDRSKGRDKRRVTSYDVARLAGVSQSAVSRAFRDGGSVAPETRIRIEDAARRLGYAPSNIARSLITQRSQLIGVVVTETTTRNYPDVLFYLGQEIQESGNRMLVFTLPNDVDRSNAISDLLSYHVDGIISGATLPEDLIEACERHDVPVVLYNRVSRSPVASAVGCDHATAMHDLVSHLAKGGIARAVFVAGPRLAPVSEDRLRGAQAALAELGLPPALVAYSDYSYEGGRSIAHSLLSSPDRPDTIICANDSMALGVLDACRYDLGLDVPREVAVSGFDDIPQAAWPSFELTTVHQPVRTMTRSAVRMLMEYNSGEFSGPERRLMSAKLIVRKSTRATDAAA